MKIRLAAATRKRTNDKRLLVLSDTCEFNVDNHKKRLTDTSGLGLVGRNNKIGFLAQSLLVLDRPNKIHLGWGNVDLMNRSMNNVPYTRDNGSVEIEEKESYKWIGPSLYCRDEVVKNSKHALFVGDMEADIYEVLDRIPNEKTDVLIRMRHKQRKVLTIDNQRLSIYEVLKLSKVKCLATVKVTGECKKRKKRLARCEVRYTEVQVPVPAKKLDKTKHSESIRMFILQIKEIKASIPKGEKGLEWNLWTSESIESNSHAIELLECYAARWHIEEGFRLLKKKGFNIEATELESGKSIRKLLLIGMEASIKVMQLKSARDGDSNIKIEEVFTEPEIKLLKKLNEKYQGDTEKQSNPHNEEDLSWASWIIARIGGWKGYASQRPPGTITFKRGLDKFETMFFAFQLMQNPDDVYKR